MAEAQAERGGDFLLVPSASSCHRGKQDIRLGHIVARVVGLPLVHLNMPGRQDQLVFPGSSAVLHPGGVLARQMAFCGEEIVNIGHA